MTKYEDNKRCRKKHPESAKLADKKWRQNHPDYYSKLQRIFQTLKINGCAICGYNKCIYSLDFHHANPEDKKFRVNSNTFPKYSTKIFTEELNKCILLCKNCHYELHYKERKK